MNSHLSQHFSVSHLTSKEDLLLTSPYITHCNNFNPVSLLPSSLPNCLTTDLTLKDHFLTLLHDLQESPLVMLTFHGSYLRGNDGKYYAWYATAYSFDVVEAESWPTAIQPNRWNYTLLPSPVLRVYANLLWLCLTLCKSVDYNSPGFSVHGIF